MESGKIYLSLGAIMKEITPIDKSQLNKAQNFNYRGIDDVMNELHGLMAKHGVIPIPRELEHIQDSYEVEKYENNRVVKKLQFRSRIHMQYQFVSTEDGSSVEADGWGEAADSGDKGYNKCKSIAFKYILTQMFVIPTKELEDPDSETPDQVSAKEDPDLELTLQLVKEAKSTEELQKVWNDNAGYKKNKIFYKAVQDKNRELSENTGA